MAKRFKITKGDKVIKRTAGQDHFNAKDPGKKTREKRSDKNVAPADSQNIKKLIKL